MTTNWVADDEGAETQPVGIPCCDSLAHLADYIRTYSMRILPGDVVMPRVTVGRWWVAARHEAYGEEGGREYQGTALGANRAAAKISRAGGHGWTSVVAASRAVALAELRHAFAQVVATIEVVEVHS